MVRCPRCGGEADRLYQIPSEAVAGQVGGGAQGGQVHEENRACSWCLHELREG